MFIKINVNEEGIGAYRISFENDLSQEEDWELLEGLGDVIISSSSFEAPGILTAAIEKTVEFLTANAFHLAENYRDIYANEPQEIEFDSDDTISLG